MSLISFELYENKCHGSHTEGFKKGSFICFKMNKIRYRRLPSKCLNAFKFHEDQRRFSHALFRV
jgi:hypothetical protein